jgi:hypothetical protein
MSQPRLTVLQGGLRPADEMPADDAAEATSGCAGRTDLDGALRLRRALEPELHAQASRLISQAELDRLRWNIDRLFSDRRIGRTQGCAMWTRIALDMVAPAATRYDLLTLAPLQKHIRLAIWSHLSTLDIHPAEISRLRELGHANVDMLSTRDPDYVHATVRAGFARYDEVLHGLRIPSTPAATRSPTRTGPRTGDSPT